MARRTDRKHVIKDGMVPLPSLTRFRSFACLERHELGIISGSGNECVPRTRRLTPFCLRFRAFVVLSGGGDLRAPDQQQQGFDAS